MLRGLAQNALDGWVEGSATRREQHIPELLGRSQWLEPIHEARRAFSIRPQTTGLPQIHRRMLPRTDTAMRATTVKKANTNELSCRNRRTKF